MRHERGDRWAARLVTLGLWTLAVGGAITWGLRLPVRDAGVSPAVLPAGPAVVLPEPSALARLLGSGAPEAGATAAAAPGGRFALQGLVATPIGEGAALISIDGKPARPFRVGAAVVDGWVLQSVAARRAVLAPRSGASGAGLVLELPVRGPTANLPVAAAVTRPAP